MVLLNKIRTIAFVISVALLALTACGGGSDVAALSFTIVEAGIEAPASLTEMMDSEGAASLFGSMFN